ncbi:hypothetical protein GYH30_034023 [Glycine max]|uniref:Uncharacterized protein n=1 Tax=Glycine max TaxID=3847 RepID=A0A0R0H6A9_SOYBN|nr:hypothetical protein GYH30_034023 [Glycine max]
MKNSFHSQISKIYVTNTITPMEKYQLPHENSSLKFGKYLLI